MGDHLISRQQNEIERPPPAARGPGLGDTSVSRCAPPKRGRMPPARRACLDTWTWSSQPQVPATSTALPAAPVRDQKAGLTQGAPPPAAAPHRRCHRQRATPERGRWPRRPPPQHLTQSRRGRVGGAASPPPRRLRPRRARPQPRRDRRASRPTAARGATPARGARAGLATGRRRNARQRRGPHTAPLPATVAAAFASAPVASRRRTTAAWPFSAARKSGRLVCPSVAFESASIPRICGKREEA